MGDTEAPNPPRQYVPTAVHALVHNVNLLLSLFFSSQTGAQPRGGALRSPLTSGGKQVLSVLSGETPAGDSDFPSPLKDDTVGKTQHGRRTARWHSHLFCLHTGVPGDAIHGDLAPVPGQQLLVEDPAERDPLPPGPLWLLEEHQVIVGLAQAGVLLLMAPAEEQLCTFP